MNQTVRRTGRHGLCTVQQEVQSCLESASLSQPAHADDALTVGWLRQQPVASAACLLAARAGFLTTLHVGFRFVNSGSVPTSKSSFRLSLH